MLCWISFGMSIVSAKATYIEYISLVFFRVQYHPDMNKSPEAEEKFKEISAAYEVIFCLVASAEVLKENNTRTC